MHLTLKGGVANRFKMLTYLRVCSAFESVCALPLSVIYNFETASTKLILMRETND
jgi:hypothetical protein